MSQFSTSTHNSNHLPTGEHTHFPLLSRHLDITPLGTIVEGVDDVSGELYKDPSSRIISAKMGKFAVENNGGILEAMQEINAFASLAEVDREISFEISGVTLLEIGKRTLIGFITNDETVAALNDERAMAQSFIGSGGRKSMFDMIPVGRTYDSEKALHIARSLSSLFEADTTTATLTLGRPVPKILTWNSNPR